MNNYHIMRIDGSNRLPRLRGARWTTATHCPPPENQQRVSARPSLLFRRINNLRNYYTCRRQVLH